MDQERPKSAVSVCFHLIRLLKTSRLIFFTYCLPKQIEKEIERHVLSQTKKLSDGSFEKIFSRNRRNDLGIFTYNCNLCGVSSLPGERSVQTHITGRKHQQRLAYDYVPNAQQFRNPISSKAKSNINFKI